MTTKGARYWHWSQGNLTQKLANAIDKIERGKSLTFKEIDELKRDNGALLNSIKPTYYDGYTGLKLSVEVLSKEDVMVKDANGKWIPDPAMMHEYNIWKAMSDHENANDSVCMTTYKSASKLQTKNVAASFDELNGSHFTKLDAANLRKQVENSDKGVHDMTKPSQPTWEITSGQDNNTEVAGLKIGDIKQQYCETVAQRMLLNHNEAMASLYSLSRGKPIELGTDFNLSDVELHMGKFYDQMRETLQAFGSDMQTIGFLETRNGEPVFKALDFPSSNSKFTQIYLHHFGKSLREKIPGIDATAVAPRKVMRQILEVDDNGVPIPGKWRIVPKSDRGLIKDAKTYTDPATRSFSGLKPGDVIIDHMRSNVPQFDKNGKFTGERFSEGYLPSIYEDDNTLNKVYTNRTPYTGKSTGAAVIAVGKFPNWKGSTISLADEVVRGMGADYDFDKYKTHISDTYLSEGKQVPYGTETTDKGMFEEYLMKQADSNRRVKDKVKELIATSNKAFTAELLGDSRAVVIQALTELNLPSTVDEFISAGGDKINIGVQNNKELQAKIALASNDNVTGGDNPVNLKPTSTELLKNLTLPGKPKSLYDVYNRKLTEDANLSDKDKQRIQDLLDSFSESDLNINTMRGIAENHQKISIGKQNVGVSANIVPVLAFLTQHHIEIDGKPVAETTADGTSKADLAMAFINAMTDNAKPGEGLAGKLGLTREALSDVQSMIIGGMDLDTAILYLLQPEVKDYYRQVANLRGTIRTESEVRSTKSRLLQDLIDSYGDRNSHNLTREQLEDGPIHGLIGNSSDEEHIHNQLSALTVIQKWTDIGSQLFSLSNVLGSISNPPVTWEEVDKLNSNMKDLGIVNGQVIQDYSSEFSVQRALIEDPITRTIIESAGQVDKISPLVFMERTKMFKRLMDIQLGNYRKLFGVDLTTVPKQTKDNILSAIFIQAYKANGGLQGVDNSLVYDSLPGEHITDIAERQRKISDNYFLTRFAHTVRPNNKSQIHRLDANNWSKMSTTVQVKIVDSFMHGYTDLKSHDDYQKMFDYLLVKDGGQFRSGSFVRYMAPTLFKELYDAGAEVKQLMAEGKYDDESAIKAIGMTWPDMLNRIVTANSTHIVNRDLLQPINLDRQGEDKPPAYLKDDNLHVNLYRSIDTTGKFTEAEKAQLTSNIDKLKSVGFRTLHIDTDKVDKKGKTITALHVALPKTITVDGKLYELQNMNIQKGQNTATGTSAIYEPTETTGAKGTYPLSAVSFGVVPLSSRLIDTNAPKRTTETTQPGYDPEQQPTTQKTTQEPQNQVSDNSVKGLSDQGIYTANIGGKSIQVDATGNEVEDIQFTPEEIVQMQQSAKPVVPSQLMNITESFDNEGYDRTILNFKDPTTNNWTGTLSIDDPKVGRISGGIGDYGSEIDEKQRGKGLGKQMYIEAAKYIYQKWGTIMKSDEGTISQSAKNVWHSLVKQGIAERKDISNPFNYNIKYEQYQIKENWLKGELQPMDWKTEIDNIVTDKSLTGEAKESFITDARDLYKSLQGRYPDNEILNKIKNCL